MDTKTDCGMLIKRINDCITRQANNELRENGLTVSQLRFLDYLFAQNGRPVPCKELESVFVVAQSTVVGILRRMELKKLISVLPSEQGGKAKVVVLTEKGSHHYQVSEEHRKETETKLLSPLQEEERKQFQGMLEKIYGMLKES